MLFTDSETDAKCLRMQAASDDSSEDAKSGAPHQIEVTPEMVEAGASRLGELGDFVSTAYLVTEVYLAMSKAKSAHPVESC
jgi:hypothetical protein